MVTRVPSGSGSKRRAGDARRPSPRASQAISRSGSTVVSTRPRVEVAPARVAELQVERACPGASGPSRRAATQCGFHVGPAGEVGPPLPGRRRRRRGDHRHRDAQSAGGRRRRPPRRAAGPPSPPGRPAGRPRWARGWRSPTASRGPRRGSTRETGCSGRRAENANISTAQPMLSAATTERPPMRAPPQHLAGDGVADRRGDQQRQDQVAAAAVVLLRVVGGLRDLVGAAGLVGRDALVLHGVPHGRAGAAQRDERGRQPRHGADRLLGQHRAQPPPGQGGDRRSRRPRRRRRAGPPSRSGPAAARGATDGSTANASPRRTSPRASGRSVSGPARSRRLRPEATISRPSSSRTAAAQWRGPWTRRPLARAIPPSAVGARRVRHPGQGSACRAAAPRSRPRPRSRRASGGRAAPRRRPSSRPGRTSPKTAPCTADTASASAASTRSTRVRTTSASAGAERPRAPPRRSPGSGRPGPRGRGRRTRPATPAPSPTPAPGRPPARPG